MNKPTNMSSSLLRAVAMRAADTSSVAAGEVMTVAAFCNAASYGKIVFRTHEEQPLREWLTAVRGALAGITQAHLSPGHFFDILSASSGASALDVAHADPRSVERAAPLEKVVRRLDRQIATLAAYEAQGVYDNPHRGFGVSCAASDEDEEAGDEDRDEAEGKLYHGQWYNFGTAGYVECACQSFAVRVDDEEVDPMPVRLSVDHLSAFFDYGRTYE